MKPSYPANKAPTPEGYRVNRAIRAKEIRVVGAEGEMLGVMSVDQGIEHAQEAGLDLVEVSPQVNPPVCKIIDYGKFKYQAQKKSSEARKKQKIIQVKEIKLRPVTNDHDYMIKRRAAEKFLAGGDKVKVTMRFRGREMSHNQIGMKLLLRMQNELEEISKVELSPKFEGRQIIMILGPKTA